MEIITVQNKAILDILLSEGVYHASYDKIRFAEYQEQYRRLSELCGFTYCPIFCAPKDDDYAIEASNCDDDGSIELRLDIPDDRCVKMDYYSWSTYLLYSGCESYDPEFELTSEEALKNLPRYLSFDVRKGDTPQVCIQEIYLTDIIDTVKMN